MLFSSTLALSPSDSPADLVRVYFWCKEQLESRKGLLPEEPLREPLLKLMIGLDTELEERCSDRRRDSVGEIQGCSLEGSLKASVERRGLEEGDDVSPFKSILWPWVSMLAQLDSMPAVFGEQADLGEDDSVLGDMGRVGLCKNKIVSFWVDDGGLIGTKLNEKTGGGGTE